MDTRTLPSAKKTLTWTAPEFDAQPNGRMSLLLIGIFVGIVVYALIRNSPLMAITFVLLGIVTYLQSQKSEKTLTIAISERGISMGREEYVFDNIISFWIIYEPEERSLFLKTKGSLISSVRVPLGDMNPNTVREALLGNIREQKYEPTIVDTLSRFLHI